jgi:hypothetical protein
VTDDDGFIGLPPGMAPPQLDADSGTIRRDRPERAERSGTDEIVFFPAPPGTPVPAPGAPADETIVPSVETPARRAAPAWRLHVPGVPEPVLVEGTLYLGRNPTAAPGTVAGTLSLVDPAKSVSKTHAMLEQDDEGLWVHDLDSTNGVWVVADGSDPVEVVPGRRIQVPANSVLELGDLALRVEHG